MSGVNLSDAAAQQRRQGLDWAWFSALFERLLRPLADPRQHPESFYHGLRLLALDGSQWSLRNSASLLEDAPAPRHHSQHELGAAFLKWRIAVLLEVGTHQPLGAACAQQSETGHEEGELTVARRVLPSLPQDQNSLLLMDRLYGNGRFLEEVDKASAGRCQVLVRVSRNPKTKTLKTLSDGSALVEARVCRPGSTRLERTVQLREIRGQVWREHPAGAGEAPPLARTEVRLWTTLKDEKEHPALELLALYARRWEQELFFRELKTHTGREQLLRAASLQGAQAEFGAMILAASLLAQQRVAAAQQVGLPPTRLSITKIARTMESLQTLLGLAGELLGERQRSRIIAKYMAHAAREARIPPRRSRSCQRGLRKPTCSWPRIQTRQDLDGPSHYALITPPFP